MAMIEFAKLVKWILLRCTLKWMKNTKRLNLCFQLYNFVEFQERRKEKRRLQDQLRRLKRREQKDKTGAPLGRPKKNPADKKPPPPPKPSLLKMKCSACGQTGHMRTNKYCPMYGQRLEQKREKEKTIGDVSKVCFKLFKN